MLKKSKSMMMMSWSHSTLFTNQPSYNMMVVVDAEIAFAAVVDHDQHSHSSAATNLDPSILNWCLVAG